jgi:hypothetical protein
MGGRKWEGRGQIPSSTELHLLLQCLRFVPVFMRTSLSHLQQCPVKKDNPYWTGERQSKCSPSTELAQWWHVLITKYYAATNKSEVHIQ